MICCVRSNQSLPFLFQKFDNLQLWKSLTVNFGAIPGPRSMNKKMMLFHNYGLMVTSGKNQSQDLGWSNIVSHICNYVENKVTLDECYGFEVYWKSTDAKKPPFPPKGNLQVIWDSFTKYVERNKLEPTVQGNTAYGNFVAKAGKYFTEPTFMTSGRGGDKPGVPKAAGAYLHVIRQLATSKSDLQLFSRFHNIFTPKVQQGMEAGLIQEDRFRRPEWIRIFLAEYANDAVDGYFLPRFYLESWIIHGVLRGVPRAPAKTGGKQTRLNLIGTPAHKEHVLNCRQSGSVPTFSTKEPAFKRYIALEKHENRHNVGPYMPELKSQILYRKYEFALYAALTKAILETILEFGFNPKLPECDEDADDVLVHDWNATKKYFRCVLRSLLSGASPYSNDPSVLTYLLLTYPIPLPLPPAIIISRKWPHFKQDG